MISLNYPNEKTKVVNSRHKKNSPVIWRRRQGLESGIVFTTYERPALSENKILTTVDGRKDRFNLGRLILSIAQAFSHNTAVARYESLWLAQTVEDKLSTDDRELTPATIADVTYNTLKQFDELAAVQYAARHHLITTIRRPGRPSLS